MYSHLLIALLPLALPGCAQDPYDAEALDASARQAIAYVDEEALARSVPRDAEILTDDRILEETRSIADFAVDHGCDVEGALGGVWTRIEAKSGGDFEGRWFKLDGSIGGDLVGSWMPADDGPGAGSIDADWTGTGGLAGTLSGSFYHFEAGDGSFLARYATDDETAQGVLGGLWYETSQDGGMFFGVWGHCSGGTDEIQDASY